MRVVLADHQADVRSALRLLVTHVLGLQVVGEVTAAADLWTQVPPTVIVASMLPIAGQTPARLSAERAYNDVIRQVAVATHAGYLDLFDAWPGLGPSYLRALRHDTEQPNPIGYEWIASTTAAFLEAGYLDVQGRVLAPRVIPTCSL